MYKYTTIKFGEWVAIYRYDKNGRCDYWSREMCKWIFTISRVSGAEVDISRDAARKLFPKAFKK